MDLETLFGRILQKMFDETYMKSILTTLGGGHYLSVEVGCFSRIAVYWNFVPPDFCTEILSPPPNAKTMREIDMRYLVICLAVITLNKHTTCFIDDVYATGVHIIS